MAEKGKKELNEAVKAVVDVWCGEFNLAPTRRLYVNDVSGRIKTKRILANFR
jgi:hypothetical protein